VLLLKTDRNFKRVLASVFTALVSFPATAPGETRAQDNIRSNESAIRARIAGLELTVVESAT
jgi:hypothetical protein